MKLPGHDTKIILYFLKKSKTVAKPHKSKNTKCMSQNEFEQYNKIYLFYPLFRAAFTKSGDWRTAQMEGKLK